MTAIIRAFMVTIPVFFVANPWTHEKNLASSETGMGNTDGHMMAGSNAPEINQCPDNAPKTMPYQEVSNLPNFPILHQEL